MTQKSSEHTTSTKAQKARSKRKPQKKSIVAIEISVSLILAAALAFGGIQAYRLLGNNLSSKDGEAHLIYIYPETSYDQWLGQIEEAGYEISSPFSLRLQSKLMRWPSEERPWIRTGCYELPAEMANLELIRKFRNGQQKPVKLTFNNIRTSEQLASRIGQQLMLDSADVMTRLGDEQYMSRYNLKKETAVCLFLPDTYEMWWDISPDQLFEKMNATYQQFWTEERKKAAEQLGLAPWEIATLASIVEEETNRDADKPIVAGLYINRLKIGMALQSDPTVKFATGDFSLRRITNVHLALESPYNTYKHTGLPPGPIRIPTKKTLDYVLHPTPSNYLYMCASDKLDGTHKFTASYGEHLNNARAYQRELNRRKIYQ